MPEQVGPQVGWQKCPQSGLDQMLAWQDEPSEDYPGAVVCIGCSYGVEVNKGSAYQATSATGFEGRAGTVRTHYVKWQWDPVQHRLEPVRMSFLPPGRSKGERAKAQSR